MLPALAAKIGEPGWTYIIIHALAFLAVFLPAMYLFIGGMWKIWKVCRTAQPCDRWDKSGKRWKSVIVNVFGQRRVISENWGWLHFFFFWGFMIHLFSTGEMFLKGIYEGISFSFITLPLYNLIKGLEDLFILVTLACVVIGFYRRLALKPPELKGEPYAKSDALWILGFIGVHMFLLMLMEAVHVSICRIDANAISAGKVSVYFDFMWAGGNSLKFFTGIVGFVMPASHTFHQVLWWIHLAVLLSFLVYITPASGRIKGLGISKHVHIFFSMLSCYMRDLTGKPNDLRPLTIDLEAEEMPQLGVKKIEHYNVKDFVDGYACTQCGRCQAECPAFNTGKPLNPKKIVNDIRHHVIDCGNILIKKHKAGKDWYTVLSDEEKEQLEKEKPGDVRAKEQAAAEKWAGENLSDKEKEMLEKPVPSEILKREELWYCTTCRACVEACPVFIEHPVKITEARRNLVMEESDFPAEAQTFFTNMENNFNPWQIGYATRADWTEGLDIPKLSEKSDVEYLLFVGCAGSFDARAKKSMLALVKILKAAGVSFGILGEEEQCCGDSLRRMGNEYLAQMLVQQNVETMNGYGVKKIIVNCPHGYNTLKNEYPDFGGKYEVISGPEIIARLIKDNKLKLKGGKGKKLTFHDSCYYGRYNNLFKEPRKAIDSVPGVIRLEMDKNMRKSFCCGAGGGRNWLEEEVEPEKGIYRINETRVDMALSKNPEIICTACPFCLTMFEDGLKAKEKEDKVKVLDIAELVADAMMEDAPDAETPE
ncbi:MAG: (Fe-S)-binding protein [Planctomycetota bacterium]|nr:MAG: (Fe-S)-binding protein [Planctomycetota bacterium]